MPYTPCHIAIVIPAARKPLVPSALAIGAMTPDIEYFLSCSLTRSALHSWPAGLFWGLPFGLAALWLWHAVFKRPLLMLLPESHQERLIHYARGFSFGPGPRFLWILVSLCLGIASHILWDSFTHADGWFVMVMPFLRIELVDLSGFRLAVYGLLQHMSTLAGAIVLVVWSLRWYMRVDRHPLPASFRLSPDAKALGVLALSLGAILPACVSMSLGLRQIGDFRSFTIVLGRAAITGMTCGLIASAVLCLLLRLRSDRAKNVFRASLEKVPLFRA